MRPAEQITQVRVVLVFFSHCIMGYNARPLALYSVCANQVLLAYFSENVDLIAHVAVRLASVLERPHLLERPPNLLQISTIKKHSCAEVDCIADSSED